VKATIKNKGSSIRETNSNPPKWDSYFIMAREETLADIEALEQRFLHLIYGNYR
jgi:hypothetical protein